MSLTATPEPNRGVTANSLYVALQDPTTGCVTPEDETQARFIQQLSLGELQHAVNQYSAERLGGGSVRSPLIGSSDLHAARDLRREDITDQHIAFKVVPSFKPPPNPSRLQLSRSLAQPLPSRSTLCRLPSIPLLA